VVDDSTCCQGIPQIDLCGLPLERLHLLGGGSWLFGLHKRQSRLLLLLHGTRPYFNRPQQANAVVEPGLDLLAVRANYAPCTLEWRVAILEAYLLGSR